MSELLSDQPGLGADVFEGFPLQTLKQDSVMVWLGRFGGLVLVLLCLSGIVWPILYYTRNEALVTLNQQLTTDLQQLQQQAQSIINQQQAQIAAMKAAK